MGRPGLVGPVGPPTAEESVGLAGQVVLPGCISQFQSMDRPGAPFSSLGNGHVDQPNLIGMRLEGIPFSEIDWESIDPEEHPGEQGVAQSRTYTIHDVRIRMLEYSAGYQADHWCNRGHVVLCVRGEFVSEQKDGTLHTIRQGAAYVVGEDGIPHRSYSEGGATLFVVD